MTELSHRITGITPSATMAVTAKANALKAAGEPVIGFGAGEPDFPTPAHILEAAIAAVRDPKNHKYTAAAGLPALRQAVAEKTLRDSGLEVGADQVMITNGGKHAIYATLATLLNPGDEVILPAPYWVSYPEQIKLAGGTPVVVSAPDTNDFKVTVKQLDEALTENTKALMFVSPSNPTGAVYSEEETRSIGEWCATNGVWLLADEIYEHLIYGDATFTSAPGVTPALADQFVIMNGVAKTYAMTGWRLGWLVGPVSFVKAATALQTQLCSNVSNISQMAALEAISGSQEVIAEMLASYDARRRVMVSMLNEMVGVTCQVPKGAFYTFPSFAGLIGTEVGGVVIESTDQLAGVFLDHAHVAAVPGEAFHAPGHMRFSYALAMDDLVEGLTRLQNLLGTKK